MPPKPVNPPSAPVLKQAMAAIVQRQATTKSNLEKARTELSNMQKKNSSGVEQQRVKTKIARLESELAAWPATYQTEVKRWLLAQPSVSTGATKALPQEIKNEISKYLQTNRIAQIEREVIRK
ncbi:uncharacterized protein B0H64DRAFT_447110 [Chaetomium fimeti]|uniref:Uncharacterized protein n=1 Tax=Chaetomium fimeti TaxID=1854472 RepID=A0AAE0H5U0_9PEZI|nr:hypothetical protein B0H64DRAFT_447110 [Chaetomium fimeti]